MLVAAGEHTAFLCEPIGTKIIIMGRPPWSIDTFQSMLVVFEPDVGGIWMMTESALLSNIVENNCVHVDVDKIAGRLPIAQYEGREPRIKVSRQS